MREKMKIIVAHPAQQHSYRLASALKNENMLFKYITTIYNKKNSCLMKLIKLFLNESNLKRANNRSCEYLEDYEVTQFCQVRGFLELLFARININIYYIWSKHTTDKFGRKVAIYAIKNKVEAVVMYDTKAEACFEMLRNKAPNIKRIIDMSAPNLEYMDSIFRNDITIEGDRDNLNEEFATKIYKQNFESSIKETKLADYFLTASEFSKNSLTNYNIDEKKIFICPYGIDMNAYRNINESASNSQKLNLLFIGRTTQKKGFFYFLDAIKDLDKNKYAITIVGNYDKKSEYYKEYKDVCEFTGFVMKNEVILYCSKADILIFPSLADGFGLSVLEALACGLPVICSQNAGVSDLIVDGYNGFVVPAADSRIIREKILWFESNRNELQKMKNHARLTASQYSWKNYNNAIITAIKSIAEENVSVDSYSICNRS